MDREEYYLTLCSFQNNLLSAVENLLLAEELTDVTLMSEGRNFKAHKVILSACSPYFRKLFKEIPVKHPVIILKDVPSNELEALLQFMYKGKVLINAERLQSFLHTAKLLQVYDCTVNATVEQNSGLNNVDTNCPEHKSSLEQQLIQIKQDVEENVEIVNDKEMFNCIESNDIDINDYDLANNIVCSEQIIENDLKNSDTTHVENEAKNDVVYLKKIRRKQKFRRLLKKRACNNKQNILECNQQNLKDDDSFPNTNTNTEQSSSTLQLTSSVNNPENINSKNATEEVTSYLHTNNVNGIKKNIKKRKRQMLEMTLEKDYELRNKLKRKLRERNKVKYVYK